MKGYDYSIRIDKPCSQSWEALSPEGKERYCSSCAKNVIDLTSLKDEEIIKLLDGSKGRLCGKLSGDQLNRLLVQPALQKSRPAVYGVLPGLFLMAATTNSVFGSGQRIPDQPVIVSAQSESVPFQAPESRQADSLEKIISGKLLDAQTREALPYATVHISNSSIAAITGADGTFSIRLPDSLLEEVITLHVTYIGYKPLSFVVDACNISENTEILIAPMQIFMLGEVGVYKTTKKWWQRKGHME
jgi:hypothetical protein